MKWGKKLLATVMVAIMVSLSSVPAMSSGTARQVTVMLDGNVVDFVDTYARIIHDYAYVPIAKIIQILTGDPPYWDDVERMASFSFGGDVYKIYISQRGIYVNDEFVEFDTGPEIADDRTMVPLRMLTNALGFEASWENTTSTVTLVSPPEPTPLALIISSESSNPEPEPGETVDIAISATSITTMIKIVDENDAIITESAHYTAEGSQNLFNVSLTPEEGKAYRIFASTVDGYNRDSATEIKLSLAVSPISEISLSSEEAAPGETISIILHASNTTSRVKLVSDLNANDVVESTSFTTDGDLRVFKLDWNMRSEYYPAGTQVTAKIYTGNPETYLNIYDIITVNVTSGARIHEAFVSPSEVNANSFGTIGITTDTSVVNVSFMVASGSGSMRESQLTSFTEASGRRRWETVYFAGGNAGTTVINVTATQANGQTSTVPINVNVKNISASSRIQNMTVKPSQITAGAQATVTITTGIDIQRVTCTNNFDTRSFDAASVSISGDAKTWVYSFVVPENTVGQVCTVTASTFDASGGQTDSNNTQFAVMPNVSLTDEIIHDVSVSPTTTVGVGANVVFTITTGIDVTNVSCYNDLIEEEIIANGGSVSGDRKIWTYELTVPEVWAGRTCVITALAYNSGVHTDSYASEIYIDPSIPVE